jgi:GTP cyclohydrolase II
MLIQKAHTLPILKKLKIIEYDEHNNIVIFGPVKLPLKINNVNGTFDWYVWSTTPRDLISQDEVFSYVSNLKNSSLQYSSALIYGDFYQSDYAVVRLHSICHTGDIFGSNKCDCGSQLINSFKKILEVKSGALFYISNHEGRGIGLFNKAMAYALQEEGYDTLEANLCLGLPEDNRDYKEVATVLKYLRKKPVSLLTNNPLKIKKMKEYGINILESIPIYGDITNDNFKYLKTKVEKCNHKYNININLNKL